MEIVRIYDVRSESFVFSHSRIVDPVPENYFLHTHEGAELIYIVEADGCHIAEDKEYKLKGRDLVVVPPGTYHGIKLYSKSVYERYNICFEPSLLEDIDVNGVFNKITVINCAEYSMIADLFKKTDYYSKKLNEKDFNNILKLVIKEIFYNLSIYDGSFDNESRFLNPILSKAIDYINKHLFEIKSLKDICSELYISQSYLFKIFDEQLKMSPKKYIDSKRLHIARKEIELGAKPTLVYEKYGFNSYTSFYRSYTAFFKHPPSQEKYYGFSNEKF